MTVTQKQAVLDKISDHGLTQISYEPAKSRAQLEVFFTDRSSLVSRTITIPELSDHGIVLCNSTLHAAKVKLSCTVHILVKADIPQVQKDIYDFVAELDHMDPDVTFMEGVGWLVDALTSVNCKGLH